jgi:hypothetical protein
MVNTCARLESLTKKYDCRVIVSRRAAEASGLDSKGRKLHRALVDGLEQPVETANAFGANHPDLITALAARYKLPAVYASRYFVTAGGLASYGPDGFSQFRRAAAYVDRILRGAKPADLPVQAPTRYELVLNLKSANALGLDVPATLLARADEFI